MTKTNGKEGVLQQSWLDVEKEGILGEKSASLHS